MKHLGTQNIETARLLLRRFSAEDAPAIYKNWATDPKVVDRLSWELHKSPADSETMLGGWLAHYDQDEYYRWAITLKPDTEPIGNITAVKLENDIRMVHIGYYVGSAWWGMGIASEALSAVIRFFFEEVGVNRIEARHDVRNPVSGKVMEKCGMSLEGTKRQAEYAKGVLMDCAEYAILAEDYKKRKC